MEKLIGFETAKKLKYLGFNENCDFYYTCALKSQEVNKNGYYGPSFKWEKGETDLIPVSNTNKKIKVFENDKWTVCSAPTQNQVFDWFRQKHNIFGVVDKLSLLEEIYFYKITGYQCNTQRRFDSYEEARESCLNEMIEIIYNDKQLQETEHKFEFKNKHI